MDQFGIVGPRAPKDEFMRALGLSVNVPGHENIYRQMRERAITVYSRMNADRNNLVEEKRSDDGCQPPFFWHHIRSEQRRQGIIETWQEAQVGTVARQLFDRGATNGEHAPNWVTLWLLYSVFRSRDFRNNRNRRQGDDPGRDNTRQGPSGGAGGGGGGGDVKFYDPARNQHLVMR